MNKRSFRTIALALAAMAVGFAQAQAATKIGFMGMLMNHLISNSNNQNITAWPSADPFSGIRMWDTVGLWSEVQAQNRTTFNWTHFDAIVSLAASNGKDILYTFGRTPLWAIPTNIAVTSASRSGNVVTVVTGAPHGIHYLTIYSTTTQSTVNLSGISDASFNGQFMITGTPSPTSFTFFQAGPNAVSRGGLYSAVCSGAYAPNGCAEMPYNLADWDAYVTAVATRANGRIKYWEMWNEANLSNFCKGDPPTLVTMTQHARTIIKAIDPQAIILSPSVTALANDQHTCDTGDPRCGEKWMSQWLSLGGKQVVDAVAVHNYPSGSPPAPEQVALKIVLERAVLTANNVSALPIWDTESGWGLNTNLPVSADQTAFLARHLLIQASMGVQRSYWYAYDNLLWGTLWWSAGQPGPAGFVGVTPAGTAYLTLAGVLGSASFPSPCAALSSDTTTWSCSMTLGDGTTAQAVWNTAGSKSYSAGAGFNHYETLDGQTHALTNPVTISKQPIILTTTSSLPVACDLNNDHSFNSADVQLAVNQTLGVQPCTTADLQKNGQCTVVDVQRIANAALGGSCVVGP